MIVGNKISNSRIHADGREEGGRRKRRVRGEQRREGGRRKEGAYLAYDRNDSWL
jgi:hypothetical protein